MDKLKIMFVVLVGLCLVCSTAILGCKHTEMRTPLSLAELRTKSCTLQSHEYSCGAASLSTLMAMFGDTKTEEEILSVIFQNKEQLTIDNEEYIIPPLTLHDLRKVSKFYNFKSIAIQAPNSAEAIKAISLLKPVMARLYLYDEYLHFVVIKDIDNGWVYVSDPGYGNFRYPISRFVDAWNAGERYLFAIAKEPFLAWENKSTKDIYLKRNILEKINSDASADLSSLFRESDRIIRFSNNH